MVLGMDWLQTLDDMTLNFKDQRVRVIKEGRTWELIGVQSSVMELVLAEPIHRIMYQTAKGCVIYVCNKEEDLPECREVMSNPQLSALCEQFANIFVEMQGLPPKRSHDHHITQMSGAEPINLRPYRHP